MTGHAVLTPLLMVILMTTGDFLSMSSTTDNVRPSATPNAWRVDNLTIAGIVLGVCNLVFCSCVLAVAFFKLGLSTGALQTFAAVTLVFSGQSVFYVVRDREHIWSSWPSIWLVLSSVADVLIFGWLATRGVLMAPLPLSVVMAVFAAAAVFAFFLDGVKTVVFKRLKMA